MKRYIIITLITILTTIYIGAIGKIIYDSQNKTNYCGKVTSIYRTDAGYKVSPEAHVIFYSDSLKRKIDVKVSNNTYANTIVGQPICFKLSKNNLKD